MEKEIKQDPVISFERYFTLLNKPLHHKAGMSKYVNIKGKKSKDEWDRLFKNY